MKIQLLTTILFLSTLNLFAQTNGIVTGRVTDQSSGAPLVGAHVTVQETNLIVSTASDGWFQIRNLADGSYELTASYVGYRSSTIQITLEHGNDVVISIVLEQSVLPGLPITVSATRGEDRSTPAAFQNLERMDIKERYFTQDIPVLLSELPSSTFYSESGNGIGYTYLNLRGFDQRRIAVMVNGIPQNDPEDHNVYWLDFPDLAASLEDIQVQRGAGSAFYGPPAIGGSINLVTQNFAHDLSLKVQAGYGSYNTRKYSASFTSGLIDNTYAMNGRLTTIQSDGYRHRSWVDFKSYFLGAVRYDEKMTTQVNFYGGPIADHLAYYGIPKSDIKDRQKRKANPIERNEEIENFSQPHYELLHEWQLTESVTLNNSFFVVFGEGFFDYDGSWAPYSYFRLTSQNGFPVVGDPDTLFLPGTLIRATVSNKQYGWLPRVKVKHSSGELIVGAELRIHRSDHYGEIQWAQQIPAGVPRDYRYYSYKGAKDIASLFVHEMYHLSPQTNLMLDLQYAYNKYRLYDEAFVETDFIRPYHFLNPRIGLNHNFDDRWNAYATMAYTLREPRLKNLYDAAEASTPVSWGAVVPQFEQDGSGNFDFSKPLVKPESLFDVELGGSVRGDAFTATLNLFWMEFSDEIVKSGQVDRFGQPITGNADRTRHVGIELSLGGKIIPELEWMMNATVSRNRFIRHTDYSSDAPLVLNKNPIAGFPDLLANGRITYRLNDFGVSLSGRFVGKQYTDNFKNEQNTVDPSFVSDAWIAYTFRNLVRNTSLEFKLQANNIFDALYAAYGEGESFFVGAERNVFFNVALEF